MYKKNKGFSLVEAAIVVAVMGIAVAAVLPLGVNGVLYSKATAEKSDLALIHTALERTVKQSYIIPGSATWGQIIKTFYSGNPNINEGGNQRVYVFPSDFISAGVNLPYNQQTATNNNTVPTNLPVDPRIMILSGMTNTVPAVTLPMSPALFDSIWNQVGQPANMTESKNFIIERINLAGIFVKVSLDNISGVSVGYKFNRLPAAAATLPANTTLNKYVINGTTVGLFDTTPSLTASPVVVGVTNYFAFNGTSWSNTISGASGGTGGGGTGGGGSQPTGNLFNAAQNGTLTTWSQASGCTPNNTNYSLSITNANTRTDVNLFIGVNGNMTFIKKIKSGRSFTTTTTECNLVTITPQDPRTGPFHVFYMPHNNLTMTVN